MTIGQSRRPPTARSAAPCWTRAARSRPPPSMSFAYEPMIGRLNHVAIVVPDLAKASRLYRETLGARVSEPVDMPEHGVTTVFVELPNAKIELLHPLGPDSPVSAFLARNAEGGMHHVCYEVDDIRAARDR